MRMLRATLTSPSYNKLCHSDQQEESPLEKRNLLDTMFVTEHFLQFLFTLIIHFITGDIHHTISVDTIFKNRISLQ